MLQRIPNYTGNVLFGDFEQIVLAEQTDCDPMPVSGEAVNGRFRHSFKLYLGCPIENREGNLVLVIKLHDAIGRSYRESFAFAQIDPLVKFVRRYDPGQRLPPLNCTVDELALLRIRFERRRDAFLTLATEQLA